MSAPNQKLDPSRYEEMFGYYRTHSLRETGKAFGINFERVRQIIKQHRPELIRAPYKRIGRNG